MNITILAVVEVGIGPPNPLEHFDAETEGFNWAQEA